MNAKALRENMHKLNKGINNPFISHVIYIYL